MSLKKEWVKPGLRVLTRSGPGELISYGEICQVVLDNAVKKIAFFEKDDPKRRQFFFRLIHADLIFL